MWTELKIERAHSMSNGIRFYSKRHKGYVVNATINEQGIIQTNWTKSKEKSKEEKKALTQKLFRLILCALPFSIIASLLFIGSSQNDFIECIRMFFISFSLALLSTFIIYYQIERKLDKNLLKFHSAEHMIINAFRDLNRIPTLEELYKYSRFSNYCGTNITTCVSITFILIFVCSFIPDSLHRVIAMLICYTIIYILLNSGKLNFMQNLTTIKPTDTELLVAIEGLNVWLDNEQKEN